jgi:hypothetical protein
VVAALKEVDAVVPDQVDNPVFLRETARPDVGAEVSQRLRLPYADEWVSHDGLDKLQETQSGPSIDLDPVTEVFAELGLEYDLGTGCRRPAPARLTSRRQARPLA